ncbi:MAG: DUF4430 domain-containing protein [Oscillospiraceae bacterium]|nr:DUF4430 domain-containing protein [Oscillospiraceae bacterium]
MQQRKNTLIIIVAVVAFLAMVATMLGIWWFNRPTPKPVDPDTTPKSTGEDGTVYYKTITVQVIHSDGAGRTFTYDTNADYLGEVLYEKGLIKNEGADEGMFNIVDGEKADWNENKSYWGLYVGEEYAMQGVDDTPINDGDSFKLVYTIG